MEESAEYRRAVGAAMDFAAPRARSRAEVLERLRSGGFSAQVAEAVVSRVEELGVVDDRLLAEDLLGRLAGKSLGRAEIERRLAKRGLSPALAADLLDGAGGADAGEYARALAAGRRKARSLKGLEHPRAVRRLAGHLARRGFEEETVMAVCRDVLGERAAIAGD